MTSHEQALAALLPMDFAGELVEHQLPNLYHCVGTDKLGGAFYGKAIIEECGIQETKTEPGLSELCCLLRAFIVIDDFAKDRGINIQGQPSLGQCLKNIQERCIELISSLAPDAPSLWAKYHQIYERTYCEFDATSLYESVINKCCLMFLPFELNPIAETERCQITHNAMKDYLFALQLMDDFQDMEEDLLAPKNHNLFVVGLEPSSASLVISSRCLIVRPLLAYVERNLVVILGRLNGATATGFIEHSLMWIRKKKRALLDLPNVDIFRGSFSEYTFEWRSLLAVPDSLRGDQVPDLQDIRAENMHTRNA